MALTRTTGLTRDTPALSGLSKSVCVPSSGADGITLLDGCERAAGLLLLAAASPVIVASAAALGVVYRRWPLIAHRRIGYSAEPFWMFKLRTMLPDDGQPSRGLFAIDRITSDPVTASKRPDDPRVANGFASFCRRHSVDELPQLWNVVNGTMAIVGPRPLTASELDRHYGSAAEEVLSVKPGLTGLWQIQGRSHLSMAERVTLDKKLVRTTSRWQRLWIVLGTVRAVFSGNGAW